MAKHYDVIVLGSGNAGMAVAGKARAAGKSVAVIESRDVGGTCPLRGCVPKKVLVAAAEVLHQIERAAEHHIQVTGSNLDWAALVEREQGFVHGVPEQFAESLKKRGIDLLSGAVKFTGPDTVAVANETFHGDDIIIATGSYPRPLDIQGSEHLITSEEILQLKDLPESLVFIGGGVIALEFAHVFARAGTKVTILEAMPRLLPRLDTDAVNAVVEESQRIGIEVLTGVDVTRVTQNQDRLDVHFTHQGKQHTVSAIKVANGTGRIANVEYLDLTAADIEHEGTRIMVDDTLRSVSNPHVYVAGDALWSSPQLSPVATYEGNIVAENILNGTQQTPDYGAIPSSVFTIPALASVGLTEAQAEQQNLAFTVKTNDMRQWRSSQTHAETVAFSKILIEDDSGRILGAHLVGHGSAEIIHLFAFAMQHNVTADQLGSKVYAYPTFASDIKHML